MPRVGAKSPSLPPTAVPSTVVNSTRTPAAIPPVRSTVSVDGAGALADDVGRRAELHQARHVGLGDVTVAVAGASTVAPLLGSLSASVNFWGPVTTKSRRIGILTGFVDLAGREDQRGGGAV